MTSSPGEKGGGVFQLHTDELKITAAKTPPRHVEQKALCLVNKRSTIVGLKTC